MKEYVPPKHWHPPTILQNPKSQNINTYGNLKTYTMMQQEPSEKVTDILAGHCHLKGHLFQLRCVMTKNRDYGRRGSAALRHPSIRKSWH
jgi:hypothetical protein